MAHKSLLAPDANGLRMKGTYSFVELENGGVAQVLHDPVLKVYSACLSHELQPSGPVLYRVQGTNRWRVDKFATELRAFQMSEVQQRLIESSPPGNNDAVTQLFQEMSDRLEQTSNSALNNPSQYKTRLAIADLDADSPAPLIFERLYQQSKGLVVGHSTRAGRHFLNDNMEMLATNDVKTLYLEKLTIEFEQPHLDTFNSTGVIPTLLQRKLKQRYKIRGVPDNEPVSLEQLITTARQWGIRIQSLDNAVSFRMAQRSDVARPTAFKYIAHNIIESDRLHRASGRWVALVGDEHINTIRGTPGLAELTASAGLRIVDLGGQPALRVVRDDGEVITDRHRRQLYIRADLRLEVNAQAAPIIRQSAQPRPCLHQPGDFLIEEVGNGFRIVSFGRPNMQETPVHVIDHTFSLNSPLFPDQQGVEFTHLADLVWSLKATGTHTQVADIPGVVPVPSPPILNTHPHLNSPGMFTTGETAQGFVVVSRAKNRALITTPVKRNEAGLYYVTHAPWGLDGTTPFNSLTDLRAHLSRNLDMTPWVADVDP